MEWTRDRGRVQSEYINLNLTKLIEKLSTREGAMEGERYGVREVGNGEGQIRPNPIR